MTIEEYKEYHADDYAEEIYEIEHQYDTYDPGWEEYDLPREIV